MTKQKHYFIEPVLTEEVAGFECFCYKGDNLVCRRFFLSKSSAEEYGDDWSMPAIDRNQNENY